jgi:hypothetical protein
MPEEPTPQHIDELITFAKRRLTAVDVERQRELGRSLARQVEAPGADVVGGGLLQRLNELVSNARERLARLEEQRARVLLGILDRGGTLGE